jgi:triacylglycerol esterase/lipase EstA (alpha/beta hydrolase family)
MTAQRETVVLVHGLYVHGLWMRLLEYWLEQAGYQTVNFSYPSMTRSPAENAEDLHRHLERVEASGRAFPGAQHGRAGGAASLYHYTPSSDQAGLLRWGRPIRAVTPPGSCTTADWASLWARGWKTDCWAKRRPGPHRICSAPSPAP